MPELPRWNREVSNLRIWFGLLGGGIGWVLHLFLTYAIAEFGCVAFGAYPPILGVSWVAWLLLAASAATLLIGLAAAWVAYGSDQELAGRPTTEGGHLSERALVRLGMYTSLLFVLIMIVQTMPIFFFLQEC